MTKFDKLLQSLFQEAAMGLPNDPKAAPPKPSTPLTGQTLGGKEALESELGPDSDVDALSIEDGLGREVDRVIADFDKRMSSLANTLSPEQLEGMSITQLKSAVSQVQKFVSSIQIHGKAKPDEKMFRNPSAIIAQHIASDPSKQAAFDSLHGDLEEFVTSISEAERQISTLKSKIDEFVANVAQPSE